MFWVDEIAQKLKQRQLPLEWVDDMKTPSGRIHVGSLRGVVVHDLIYKALRSLGVNARYTYLFEDHDPMDDVPTYLPEEYKKYLGLPLFRVPSPERNCNYAEFFAKEFQQVFNAIGCNPEIIWTKDLYTNGRMNGVIKEALDNAEIIKDIYEKLYKKKIVNSFYPFQPYCEQCGKVSTTTVTGWDGEKVTYVCELHKVKFTQGCGYKSTMSPFSGEGKIVGKLPWKIEWPAKWKVLGVTVEGAGKDHMSAGGSHDVAKQVCERIFHYPVPYPLPYEWFILGKKKMSTSKGVGASAVEMLDILPPELLRFVMIRSRINSEINFDLNKPSTIPDLFDEYQRCADAHFQKGDPDFARAFELSQIDGIRKPPKIRFSVLAQWIQMPSMISQIKREGLTEWTGYAKNWLEKYAPESEKFFIQKELPEDARNLSDKQKKLLQEIAVKLDGKWEAESFQFHIYEWGKALGLSGKEVFSAIYKTLIGKDHGPKAAWLILSLDKDFVKKRFNEASNSSTNVIVNKSQLGEMKQAQKRDHHASLSMAVSKDVFYIDEKVKEKFPSISIGVAIIKGVKIEKTNIVLEKEKEKLLFSLEELTTEELGKFPEIVSYRKLYREMGIDWHSRRPSPEALLRRVVLKKGLYTVNTCVDACNLAVMKNRVSIGAFDLDTLAMPTVMRFPKKGEEVLLLGDTELTTYTEKELAYFDQNGGFNIDFNFRDSQRTAVLLGTKNLYINVDGIYDVALEQVEKVLKETCDIIIKYCGGMLDVFGVETA